ncbi:hypothetical protein CRG98_001930 [Punica granatum]|uniref:Uncharacterized protein n=1 Tax=Punica granatum TaxID=22663 RepID=A0A2I0LAL4_PUNGR|nr:hypothetical protein CRG98_001930 [Punica granatum]
MQAPTRVLIRVRTAGGSPTEVRLDAAVISCGFVGSRPCRRSIYSLLCRKLASLLWRLLTSLSRQLFVASPRAVARCFSWNGCSLLRLGRLLVVSPGAVAHSLGRVL